MPKPTVKTIADVVLEQDFKFLKPQEMADGSRFSVCKGPYLQTPEMVVNVDEAKQLGTVICASDYADTIALIEDAAVDALANNAVEWFKRELSHDDVDHMMKAAIKGHRVPKHVVKCNKVVCYDHELNPVDMPTEPATATLILQVEGIRLEGKRCEISCVLRQMKLAAPPPPEVPVQTEEQEEQDEPLTEPAFIG